VGSLLWLFARSGVKNMAVQFLVTVTYDYYDVGGLDSLRQHLEKQWRGVLQHAVDAHKVPGQTIEVKAASPPSGATKSRTRRSRKPTSRGSRSG
jgi:hypothetical protein